MPPTLESESRRTGALGAWPPFARFAWGVLGYNIAVVLWGAYVRATGSGAGCGRNWPLCNELTAARSPSAETLIEFTHRAMSGLDLIAVLVLVVWAFRAFPKGHPVRLGATLSGIFLITEALLGAGLVLLEHVADNASAARGWSMSTHLVNTLLLLACLTLTAWWGMGKPAVRWRGKGVGGAVATLAIFVVLGVTGAIAALGDTLFPSQSLAEGLAQDFDPAANLFVRLRWLHPVTAALGGTWLLFSVLARLRFPHLRPYAAASFGLLAVQLAAGAVNLLLLAPVWMQIVHLFLADAAWISLVLLTAGDLADPAA